MQKTILAVFVSILFLLTAPLNAEIYKFTDENGQKRWTDDLSQVPIDQRNSAQRIESVSDKSQETADGQAESNTPAVRLDTGAATPDPSEPVTSTDIDREALEREKAQLDSQYQQLLEERKQLEEMKAEAANVTDRTELNERIAAYNAKTEQYETQLNAFNEKINAYNQQITKKRATPTE